MADRLGNGTVAGVGEQIVFATAVARTVWWPLVSTSLQRSQKYVPRETLAQNTSFNARSHYLSEDRSGGALELLMQYEGMGFLLKHLLGGTPGTTGSGPYTHVFGVGATLPAGLTVELQRGTGTSELYTGCRISKATFKLETGKEMRVTVDLVGRTTAARTTAVTPTWTTSRNYVVDHQEAGALLFDSVAYTLDSFTLTIDNKLSPRQSLGSALPAEIPRSGRMEITLEATITLDSDALHTALTAHTQGDAVIAFTSLTAAGASLTFNLNNAFVAEAKDPISAIGPIKQNVKWIGQADAGSEGLTATLVNSQANPLAA